MPKINVRIDGIMVTVVAIAAAGVWLYSKRGEILNKINLASDENLVYQGVSAVSIKGDHNGYSYDDHVFAAIDLLNPFNGSDVYAEKVWGLSD